MAVEVHVLELFPESDIEAKNWLTTLTAGAPRFPAGGARGSIEKLWPWVPSCRASTIPWICQTYARNLMRVILT